MTTTYDIEHTPADPYDDFEGDIEPPNPYAEHDGHDIYYYQHGVTTVQDCQITPEGHVLVTSSPCIEEISESEVFCVTCRTSLGCDNGLSPYWEVM